MCPYATCKGVRSRLYSLSVKVDYWCLWKCSSSTLCDVRDLSQPDRHHGWNADPYDQEPWWAWNPNACWTCRCCLRTWSTHRSSSFTIRTGASCYWPYCARCGGRGSSHHHSQIRYSLRSIRLLAAYLCRVTVTVRDIVELTSKVADHGLEVWLAILYKAKTYEKNGDESSVVVAGCCYTTGTQDLKRLREGQQKEVNELCPYVESEKGSWGVGWVADIDTRIGNLRSITYVEEFSS